MNFNTVVAYHFCPSLPAAFTQPAASTTADLCKVPLCVSWQLIYAQSSSAAMQRRHRPPPTLCSSLWRPLCGCRPCCQTSSHLIRRPHSYSCTERAADAKQRHITEWHSFSLKGDGPPCNSLNLEGNALIDLRRGFKVWMSMDEFLFFNFRILKISYDLSLLQNHASNWTPSYPVLIM